MKSKKSDSSDIPYPERILKPNTEYLINGQKQ